MFRLIRVVLGLEVSSFSRGLGSAARMLSGFVGSVRSGISSAVGFFNSLINTIAHLPDAIETVTGAIEGLFGPALSRERYEAIFTSVTGNAEQAAEMVEYLRNRSTDLGLSFDGLADSSQQVAVALRGQFGEIDPEKWEQLTNIIIRLKAVWPRVPEQFWGRGVSAFLAGDTSTLTRLIDINIDTIKGIKDSTRAFLEQGSAAVDEQLGQVTRLSNKAASASGDGIAALEDLLQSLGVTEDVVNRMAETTQGKLDRLKAQWQDFVARVGTELLPLLIKALDKLLKWIDTHEEDIQKFIENFGEFARTNFSNIQSFLQNVQWNNIAEAANSLAEFVNSLSNLGESPVLSFLGDALGNPLEGTGGHGTAFEAGQAVRARWEAASSGASSQMGTWIGNTQGSGVLQDIADVISGAVRDAIEGTAVQVGVDPQNGNITAHTRRVAQHTVDESFNEFMNQKHQIQRGNTSAGGGPR